METGFWRNFTWKKFAINTIINLACFTIYIFIDERDFTNYNFTKAIIKIICLALFAAFWITIWQEKSDKNIYL